MSNTVAHLCSDNVSWSLFLENRGHMTYDANREVENDFSSDALLNKYSLFSSISHEEK